MESVKSVECHTLHALNSHSIPWTGYQTQMLDYKITSYESESTVYGMSFGTKKGSCTDMHYICEMKTAMCFKGTVSVRVVTLIVHEKNILSCFKNVASLYSKD